MSLKLRNQTKNVELALNVRVANTFWSRAVGLLADSRLDDGHALWIQRSRFAACNSIHTFFMRFAIDAVFVDRELRVRRVFTNLGPWRMTLPAAGAESVFEMPAGTIARIPVDIGDQLYVGN